MDEMYREEMYLKLKDAEKMVAFPLKLGVVCVVVDDPISSLYNMTEFAQTPSYDKHGTG